MTPWQTLRRVTIPVASVIAFPTLVNHFIGMLKASSLAFVVSLVEITAYAKILGGRDYRFFEAFLATAIVYWALTVLIEQVARVVERRMQRPPVGRARQGRGSSPAPEPVLPERARAERIELNASNPRHLTRGAVTA